MLPPSPCQVPRLRQMPTAPKPRLTVNALQLGGQGGLQGAAAVPKRGLQLRAAAVGQVLLHLAGAAGVALGADPQVLACGEGWTGRRGCRATLVPRENGLCQLEADQPWVPAVEEMVALTGPLGTRHPVGCLAG